MTPFRDFFHTEAAGGILLFIAAIVAIGWANSAWGDSYRDLWAVTLSIHVAGHGLSKNLGHWINDGLMVIFFFVVGLEIKREVMVGELASPRQAALPIVAAFGGALVPAIIYVAFNAGRGDALHGWGVPMATDIAFALGVLALLGERVPIGLKVFLTALAIVDDLIAVLVIALFYTDDLAVSWLAVGAAILGALVLMNRLDVPQPLPYMLLGVALWFAFIQSGVHATIAGVLLAMTIPARTRIDSREFLERVDGATADFRAASDDDDNVLTNRQQQGAIQDIESASEAAQAPMQRLEHLLHPWVAFAIVPIFALANAGVVFGRDTLEVLTGTISLGVIVGLVAGKQIGITLSTWLLVRSGAATLPEGVSMRQIHAAACLAGIGFTMSLFIAELAFDSEAQMDAAKVGILGASVIAGVAGYALLRLSGAPDEQSDAPERSPDQREVAQSGEPIRPQAS